MTSERKTIKTDLVVTGPDEKSSPEDTDYMRFSGDGDFKSQADIDKMSDIADVLALANIKVYGYTTREDLDYSNISDNMTVNGLAEPIIARGKARMEVAIEDEEAADKER